MNARDYAKVYLTYWTGTTGQRITTPEAKLVGLYLFTGPHVMLTHSGVWRIDEDTVEEHTGIKPGAYRAALAVLEEAGLVELDARRKWVWVREFAMFQLCGQGRPNAPSPDIKKCWSEYVALSRQCPDLAERWYERYESDLYLRDSASAEAVRLGKRTAEIPRGKSADSKKPSDTQSESRRTQSTLNQNQGAPNPIQGEVNQNQGDTNRVQSALNQNQDEPNASILYQDTFRGSEVQRVRGSERRTHAHANPSQTEVAEGGMASWLDMDLEERAKVLVSRSLSEIPPGVEDHVATIQGVMHRVIAHYVRKCPGVVKSKNLSFAVGRAVSVLVDDSELTMEESERRLVLMLDWFEQVNPRRWSNGERGSGQDWFGDSVQVFGGKSGMLSANGVNRDTATILASNLTQALDWEAAVIRRNTPPKRDEDEWGDEVPMSTEELARKWAELKETEARKARCEVSA